MATCISKEKVYRTTAIASRFDFYQREFNHHRVLYRISIRSYGLMKPKYGRSELILFSGERTYPRISFNSRESLSNAYPLAFKDSIHYRKANVVPNAEFFLRNESEDHMRSLSKLPTIKKLTFF